MLKQSHRLKKKKEIEFVMKRGKMIHGDFVMLKVWYVNGKEPFDMSSDAIRIGVTVGKKVSSSAVKRNRKKRQLREVIRLLVKDSKLKKGSVFMVIGKPTILDQDYAAIEQDIFAVCKKARLLTQ